MNKLLNALGITPAFLKGYGSVIDLFGFGAPVRHARTSKHDAMRLSGDWTMVGYDIQHSLNEYGASSHIKPTSGTQRA